MKAHHQKQIIPQHCPLCSAAQKHLSYTALTGGRVQSVVHITCAQCSGNILAFVSQNDAGLMTVGMITDLSMQEAQVFMSQNAVNGDDVLALHRLLSEAPLMVGDLTQ